MRTTTKAGLIFMMGSIAMSALASPITYNIIFPGGGFAPTSGSFTYDASAPLASRFANFTVNWDNLLFNFTSAANTGENFFGTDCGTSPSSQSVFMFLSGQNVCVNAATIEWTGFAMMDTFNFADAELAGFGPPDAAIEAAGTGTPGNNIVIAGGPFSIAPVASTPEPATLPLVLSCVGLFGIWRRAWHSKGDAD